MECMSGYQFLPGDPRLVENIVCELKSQGIFDQFRKECLADVDTKPAYQNLRQRVEGSVSGFLNAQKWKPEMNKNQLREKLRKTMQESGFLETGVERIVDQVVNPKISTVFLPQVEDVVYKYLGLEKPHKDSSNQLNGFNQLEVCTDLLPNDLEAISPDSVSSVKQNTSIDDNVSLILSCENEDITMKDVKHEEDESPPFELLHEKNVYCNENSNDSHLSGISGLTSQGSIGSPKQNTEFEMENLNQDSHLSRISSSSRISAVTSSDIIANTTNNDNEALLTKQNLSEKDNLEKPITVESSSNSFDQSKIDVDSCISNDSDAKAMVIVTESSNDTLEDKSSLGNVMNGLSINSNNENDNVEDEGHKSENTITSKSEKQKCHDESKRKEVNSHTSKSDKHHHTSHHQRSRHSSYNKQSENKHKTDHNSRSRSHKDVDKKRSKTSPKKSSHSSRSEKDRRDRSDTDSKNSSDRHNNGKSKSHKGDSSKSHSSDYIKSNKKYSDDSGSDHHKLAERNVNEHGSKERRDYKEKINKKSKYQDDHNSAKNSKSSYRRSTDRDSNDGSGTGSKNHSTATHAEHNSSKRKENTNETIERNNSNEPTVVESIQTVTCNAVSDESKEKIAVGTPSPRDRHEEIKLNSPLLMRKPKIASNIFEARRLIKVRRKIERQVQRELLRQQRREQFNDNLKNSPVETTPGTLLQNVESVKENYDEQMLNDNNYINNLTNLKTKFILDRSEFFGFSTDHRVFYDSDIDISKVSHNATNSLKEHNCLSREPHLQQKINSNSLSDENNEHSINTASKAEIMEIIFGRDISLPNKECCTNAAMNIDGGFQVSYCSDYDDDYHYDKVSSNEKDITKTKSSLKANDINNCTNNNVLQNQNFCNGSLESAALNGTNETNIESSRFMFPPDKKSVNEKYSKSSNAAAKSGDLSIEPISNSSLVKNQMSKSRSPRSSVYNSQCYSNEDLYKPRPSFGSSRRRRVSALYT